MPDTTAGLERGGPVDRPAATDATCASRRQRRARCRSSPGSCASRRGSGARRALPHAAARLDGRRHRGADRRRRSSRSRWSRRCRSRPSRRAASAALAAVALVANFCGALLSQNGDAVTSAFDQSDQALGVALAIARAGVLVSLVAIALADRWGRRRLILVALVGACAANLLTALAPTFEVFTGAQLLNRALVNTVLDRRRHRRGRGRARGRARVRHRDVRARARRRVRALGGPAPARRPRATTAGASRSRSAPRSCSWSRSSPATSRRRTRYVRVASTGRAHARAPARAVRLAPTARASCCSGSPRSSPTCSARRRHSSPTATSPTRTTSPTPTSRVFRTVTAGVPGIIGVLLASRLAESRGRRPVTIIGLLVATVFQGAFFLAGDDAAALDHAGDRDRRRRVRGARARHPRRRAVPHRGARHVERVPAGLGRGRLGRRPGAGHPAQGPAPAAWAPPSRSAGSRRWSPRSSWCRDSPRRPIAVSTTSARPRCEQARQLEVHVDGRRERGDRLARSS